jgi:hypothetical protein
VLHCVCLGLCFGDDLQRVVFFFLLTFESKSGDCT